MNRCDVTKGSLKILQYCCRSFCCNVDSFSFTIFILWSVIAIIGILYSLFISKVLLLSFVSYLRSAFCVDICCCLAVVKFFPACAANYVGILFYHFTARLPPSRGCGGCRLKLWQIKTV